ncbi:MAG: hypothetical protein ACK5LT_12060 [Lachnospirales bacterium]
MRLGDFDQEVHEKTVQWKNKKTGWTIEKDREQHKENWKLKDKKGGRIATLDGRGRIFGD